MVQDVDEKDLEARRGNDTHFAGLHPQIQAAILLVERFSETLHEYGEFQGHPHRSVSHECACLIRDGPFLAFLACPCPCSNPCYFVSPGVNISGACEVQGEGLMHGTAYALV